MADFVFFFRGDLCKRFAELREVKQGVVTEAAVSALLFQNLTVTYSARFKFTSVGKRHADNAHITCGTVRFIRKFRKQFFVVCSIVSVTARIPCAHNSGAAVKRKNFKSAVVRNARHSACFHASHGFYAGVFLKCFSSFFGVGFDARLTQGNNIEKIAENGSYLFYLMRVV